MKKITFFFFFLAFAFGLECFGQKQPLLPYGKYSIEDVKTFVKDTTSDKSIQYKEYILEKYGEVSVDSLFQKISVVEDTTLLEGTYENSCWDFSLNKIEFFPGKEFTGGVMLYDNGFYQDIFCKDTCINILNTNKKYLNPDDQLIAEDQEAKNYRGVLSPSSPASAYPPVNGDKNNNQGSFNQTTNITNYYFYSDSKSDPKKEKEKEKTLMGKVWPWLVTVAVLTTTICVVGKHNDWWRAGVISPSVGGQGFDPDPQGGK